MAPKSSLMPRSGQLRAMVLPKGAQQQRACPICSMAGATRRTKPAPMRPTDIRRRQSTAPSAGVRKELEQALLQLQKQTPRLLNLSRLQLALRGLQQSPGDEAVRIAVLGLQANGSSSVDTARNVLRALLADPLEDEQPWEKQLDSFDLTRPLIVSVGAEQPDANAIEFTKESPVQKLHISSAQYNSCNVEFLLMNMEAPDATVSGPTGIQAFEDAVLVPMVDVPADGGRFTQMTTPVHQALIVGQGLHGAVGILALPASESSGAIATAVDMKGVSKEDLDASINIIDAAQAEEAVALFRQGPQNAMQYERRWFASNIPALADWLKAGVKTADASTKPAVKSLIASLIQNTHSAIQAEESVIVSKTLTSKTPLTDATGIHQALAEWARTAHGELQQELDLAFSGRRWRKLGWWKLFWRVDDVGMLTNDMLNQRFLPTAEQELVYLAGRVAALRGTAPNYPQPISETATEASNSALPKWPGHIAFTRRYLQNETVPALQALAQRLLVQSLGTSSVSTALAALLYVSATTSTLYEAGAVAALGIVYSLGRMQKKWEAARRFWEGDVREEGRKAVRGVEESVAKALVAQDAVPAEVAEELQKARELVSKAEELLAQLK